MSQNEIPIQVVEWTGLFTCSELPVVSAVLAVITHFVNIIRRGDIRLRADLATIRMKAHTGNRKRTPLGIVRYPDDIKVGDSGGFRFSEPPAGILWLGDMQDDLGVGIGLGGKIAHSPNTSLEQHRITRPIQFDSAFEHPGIGFIASVMVVL